MRMSALWVVVLQRFGRLVSLMALLLDFRFGQLCQKSRRISQRKEGQGKAHAERHKHGNHNKGRLRHGVSHCARHERGRAGCGHYDGQRAGKKCAGPAALRHKTAACILQPRAEINLSAQDIPELGIGAGVDAIEAGIRLRYEFSREFAPYVGIEQEWKLGGSRSFALAAGEDPSVTNYVVGIRFWF